LVRRVDLFAGQTRASGYGFVVAAEGQFPLVDPLTNRPPSAGMPTGNPPCTADPAGDPQAFGEFIQFRLPTGDWRRGDLIHSAVLLCRTFHADVPIRAEPGQTRWVSRTP
jgi:hypothetical protein